jgi:photosystem II stability/assembly factor-like uncharacterized protein
MRSFVAAGFAVLAGAVLVPAGGAGAAVQLGQSGWAWASPAPQGNSLFALGFAGGGRGYAAGAFGTVLRTDDGGLSWTGLPTSRTFGFNRLSVLGRDAVVVGARCSLRRSDDAGATWKRLQFDASESRCAAELQSFSFPTSQVGFLLLSTGSVLRTDDGGDTFSRGTTSIPRGSDLVFTSPDSGLATVGNTIGRTTDGARSWTTVHEGGPALRALHMATSEVAYAVGEAGRLLRSADGGRSWEERGLTGAGAPGTLTGIRCATADVCLITSARGDRLLRTSDGGHTASVITASSARLYAVGFADASRAVAVGDQGATVYSSDGGQGFAPVGGRLAGRYSRLRRGPGQSVFAAGADGALARSADGGATWSEGSVSTTQHVVDVAFPTAARGFAIDAAGTLLRTENSGASWRILTAKADRPPRAVFASSAKTILLVGPTGVDRSTNAGDGFDPVRSRAVQRARLSDADRAGAAVVVSGPQAIAVSTDGGRRWRSVRLPRRRLALQAVDFVSARLGYAVVEDGRLYRTRNGGRRWVEVRSLGDVSLAGIAFGGSRSGWALADSFPGRSGGWVLRTDDGGRTWRPQLAAPVRLVGREFGTPTLLTLGGRTAAAFSPGRQEADDDYGSGPSFSGPQSFHVTARAGDLGRESRLTLHAPRRARRGSRVRLGGRLSPAQGGETVLVFTRAAGSTAWTTRSARVTSRGAFGVTLRLRGGIVAAAQWTGGDGRASAGTPAVVVRVR